MSDTSINQSALSIFFGRLGRHALRGIEQLGDGTMLGLGALGLFFSR